MENLPLIIPKENKIVLENKLKELEGNLNTEDNIQSYNIYKKELDSIYDHIAEGIRIRSKCDWYEHGEKSSKFFLNLEKKRGNQNQIRKLIIDEKEIDGDVEILKKIESFYETLFKSQSFKNVSEIEKFLCGITTPSLNNDQINLCEKDLSETDLYNAMKNMQNNKSPGNDGLTKEFYEGFWDEIKELLIASATEAKHRGELSISQRQAIIKLIEKKDRDKRYIKNWRPISLLNVDTKIISKALSERLKNVLSSLIST